MKKIVYIVLFIILLIISLCVINVSSNYNINNSIVFIETNLKEGMGFVYKIKNNKNYIVTNYHVINDSEYIYIYNLKNKKEIAKIVDYDTYSDIALLEISNNLGLKESEIGINSVKKGDNVYYFNIDKYSIDKSKVVELNNEIILNTDYGNSFYNAVSIKANISEGNSGGPIFNNKNEVIGMISLKEENSNISFYLPIDNMSDIVTKLENHTLVRPNLGGMFVNTTNKEILNEYQFDITRDSGVVVLEVTKDYPLYLAGIIKGDVITKINDIVIEDVNELQNKIYSFDIGDTINLEYYRGNVFNSVAILLNN